MAQCATCVPRLYKSVIEEVMANVRDAFLDEGIDEQVLLEVKQAWEQRLTATRATDHHGGLVASGQQPQGTGTAAQNSNNTNNNHAAAGSAAAGQQPLQQTAHQQVASGLAGQAPAPTPAAVQAPAPVQQPQINLVPVQITVPAQQAGGTAKTITIHVPSTALANGVAGTQLQTILSAPSAAHTFTLEASQAAEIIQRQLNTALQKRGITLPPQLLIYNNPATGAAQLDGAVGDVGAYMGEDGAVAGCHCSTVHKRIRNKKKKPRKRNTAALDVASPLTSSVALEADFVASEIPRTALLSLGTSTAFEESTVVGDVEGESSSGVGNDGFASTCGVYDTGFAVSSAPGVSNNRVRGSSRCWTGEDRLGPSLHVDRTIMDNILLQRLAQGQVDGNHGPIDDSSDEMSGDDDDDDDDKDEEDEKDKKFEDEEEEEDAADLNEDPLNSADDVSDDESGETFETDNVVVCQYDKITRVRNRWKFNLKDGIMNLKGKDYVFLKATGEAEW